MISRLLYYRYVYIDSHLPSFIFTFSVSDSCFPSPCPWTRVWTSPKFLISHNKTYSSLLLLSDPRPQSFVFSQTLTFVFIYLLMSPRVHMFRDLKKFYDYAAPNNSPLSRAAPTPSPRLVKCVLICIYCWRTDKISTRWCYLLKHRGWVKAVMFTALIIYYWHKFGLKYA